jgi:DNA-binding MarR family transcriptional regulator
MALEEKLKTKGFDSPAQRSRANLLYSHSWLQDQVRQALEPFGLTQQQHTALLILRSHHPKPISTKDLGRQMVTKMTDSSRLVDRLVAKGWVAKKNNDSDRRLVDVTLTPKGADLLKKLDAHQAEMDAILSRLSDSEHLLLNSLLDKLRGEG